MRRTAHRRAAGRAAPTGVLTRVRLAGTDVHEGEHPDVVEEARCAFSILVSISTEISCHARH